MFYIVRHIKGQIKGWTGTLVTGKVVIPEVNFPVIATK